MRTHRIGRLRERCEAIIRSNPNREWYPAEISEAVGRDPHWDGDVLDVLMALEREGRIEHRRQGGCWAIGGSPEFIPVPKTWLARPVWPWDAVS